MPGRAERYPKRRSGSGRSARSARDNIQEPPRSSTGQTTDNQSAPAPLEVDNLFVESIAIQLRPLAADDWSAVHQWAQQPEVCRFQAWGPNTPEQTQTFTRLAADAWRHDPQLRFPFAVVVDDAVVGSAELNLRGNRQGEISYIVHPGFWGRGIATGATRELLDMCFGQHELHRVFATCDPRNAASARVLKKLGMTYEGRLRETTL